MRNRDVNTGRFKKVSDQIAEIYDLFVLFFKLLFIFAIVYGLYQYYEGGEIVKNLLLRFIWGNTCKVTCEKNGYFN